ncbi:hypothetical protein DOY81_002198 [Sarcophaga bullata]|nr:hypothetical protein DOY81_002198 [Sarcophaga bullata]
MDLLLHNDGDDDDDDDGIRQVSITGAELNQNRKEKEQDAAVLTVTQNPKVPFKSAYGRESSRNMDLLGISYIRWQYFIKTHITMPSSLLSSSSYSYPVWLITREKLYTADKKRFFYIENEYKYDWFESMIKCTRMNMSLLTIDSKSKSDEINKIVKTAFGKNVILWVGGYAVGKNRQFTWIGTGEEFSYTYWNGKNPDFNNNDEYCVQIGWSASMQWNDNKCTSKYGFVCEFRECDDGNNSRHYNVVVYNNQISIIFNIALDSPGFIMKTIIVIILLNLTSCFTHTITREKLFTAATSKRQYYIENEHKYDWFESWAKCARMNMVLVTIDSKTKSDEINKLVLDSFGKKLILWVGGYALGSQRQFTWMATGEEFTYTFWYDKNPDFYNQEEYCAQIGWHTTMQWNDNKCTKKFGFMCEFKSQINEESEMKQKNQNIIINNYQRI